MRLRNRAQCLYVIVAPTGECKIGVAEHPETRLGSLAGAFPRGTPRIAFKSKPDADMWMHEQKLHARFADRRLNGEWFDIIEDEAVAAARQQVDEAPELVKRPAPAATIPDPSLLWAEDDLAEATLQKALKDCAAPVGIKGARKAVTYRPSVAKVAGDLYELGATDREVAKCLGVNWRTLFQWASRYPEFREAKSRGDVSIRVMRGIRKNSGGQWRDTGSAANCRR